jgi:Serine dehydrogenase proteinase
MDIWWSLKHHGRRAFPTARSARFLAFASGGGGYGRGVNASEEVEQLAGSLNADVLLYNGAIEYDGFYRLLDVCGQTRSPNLLLFLTTLGGNPHAAYRIAKCLRQSYRTTRAFIPSFCKSAGTLIVLGMDEIVLGSAGELGPLDMQLRKRDELDELGSANDLAHGLAGATVNAMRAFQEIVLDLCVDAGLTAKLGASVATELVAGLYSKVFEQIDPTRLGEVQRANMIAKEYGKRLSQLSAHTTPQALERLVHGYPSHGFVIDLDEAKQLFSNARGPTADEHRLAALLESLVREPRGEDVDIRRLHAGGDPDEQAQQTEPSPSADPPIVVIDKPNGDGRPATGAEGGESARGGDLGRNLRD